MRDERAELAFSPSPGRTLGVEWELGLVDPETLDLTSRAEDVIARVSADGPRGAVASAARSTVTKELLRNTVELVTGICENAEEAAAHLQEGLDLVRGAADELDVLLFGGGAHPFTRWEDAEVTAGERYATLIDRTQMWGRQMVIFGVHVHVGVRSAAKVWPLVNALLTHHPHLTALSASSPYSGGADTGYASNRTMLFQQLPTAGLPFQFETWEEYRRYLHDVFTTGVIDDVSELRWDIRPSMRLGTIEVRACDGMSRVQDVAALAALVHCLVVHLESRLDEGRLPAPLPPWHVQENKWRAARYGLEAIVIADAESREVAVVDDTLALLDRLEPVARSLGCATELREVERIARGDAGYRRMRAAAEAADGDLREAVRVALVAPPGDDTGPPPGRGDGPVVQGAQAGGSPSPSPNR